MAEVYIPLLTYTHAEGVEGSEVVPGLAREMPKITNGGKTYTMFLRPGLKYSDGTPVKASDFTYAVERLFKVNSGGSPFYTDIVGAEQFAKTKTGGIPGIKTNDKTGEIVIDLVKPRGTFVNELGLMFVAPVPPNTPDSNQSTNPPPGTGPYMITKSDPGQGWSYERNPYWAKANSKAMPEYPSGHMDKINVTIIRNPSTQVNDIEQGKFDWMQTQPPPDRYPEVKSKYEGTQLRVEPTISTYYFWMNTNRPPFNDLKVRQAVNYAVDQAALERIYVGSIAGTQQILPPGMPGYKKFELYPHNLAKAKAMIKEAHPSDMNITVWGDSESENEAATTYYQDLLTQLGFHATLKILNPDNYFTVIGNQTDARPRHRLVGLVPGLPAPERLLPAHARRRKHPADQQQQLRRDRQPEVQQENRQARRRTARPRTGSRVRGARPGIHGRGALGSLRDADALDLRLQRDQPRKRHLQPDLRSVPDQLRIQVGRPGARSE